MSRNALSELTLLRWLLPTLCGWLLFCHGRSSQAASTLAPNGRAPRARVVIVQDARATTAFQARPEVVAGMVRRGITNITGKASATAAWRSLVSTQDVVGIKVFSSPGPNSGTRPAVVAAIIQELIAAGLPAKNIIVWDKYSVNLRLAGFFDLADRYGVRVAGGAQEGMDDVS